MTNWKRLLLPFAIVLGFVTLFRPIIAHAEFSSPTGTPQPVNNATTATTSDQRNVAIDDTGRDTGAYKLTSCLDLNVGLSVTNTTSLDEAIDCFNAVTDPGQYTISFTDNISLTANLPNCLLYTSTLPTIPLV